MTTLKFTTVDQHLVLQRQPVVASGDKNSVLIQIQLCSMWDGFDVKVAFYKDGNRDFVLDIPLEKGECMVPPEMLDSPCVLNIGIWGKDAKGRYKTSTMVKYRVQEGTPIEAGLTLIDVSDGTAAEDQVLEGATFFAGDTEMKAGNIKTYEDGDPVYMTPYTENDPTVPAWAKQPTKPTYTATEVGARPADWTPTETDPTVPAWAKQEDPPVKPAEEVVDSTALSIKPVPADAAPYAEVVEIGGMTRKCTNLIPLPYYSSSKTVDGVTFTINTDSSVSISGTATGEAIFYPFADMALNGGQTYTVSAIGTGRDDIMCYIRIAATNEVFFGTFTAEDNVMYQMRLVVPAGKTVNARVYPMLNAGSTALPYEPYFEGLRSAPVTAVESVGVNLLDESRLLKSPNITASGTEYILSAGAYEIDTGINYKPNTQYTLAYTGKNDSGAVRLEFNYADGTRTDFYFKSTEYINSVFTTAKNKSVKELRCNYSDAGNLYIKKGTVMIYEGADTKPYTPYTRHTLPIPETVRNIDGYGWGVNNEVYNYIDYEKKQFVKRVEKFVLRGTENWVLYNSNLLTSQFDRVSPDLSPSISDGAFNSEMRNGNVKFCVYTDGAHTEETWKSYLAEKPMTVYYELATPIITDISDILPADNIIGVKAGGTVTMVNEYGYDVPNTITFYAGKNEVVGADTFVGNLHGTAARALADGEGKKLATREWVLEQLAAMTGGDGA